MQFYILSMALFPIFSQAIALPPAWGMFYRPLAKLVEPTTAAAAKGKIESVPLTKQSLFELNAINNYKDGLDPNPMPASKLSNPRYWDVDLGIIAKSVINVENWFKKNNELEIAELRKAAAGRMDPNTKKFDGVGPVIGRESERMYDQKLISRSHSSPQLFQ